MLAITSLFTTSCLRASPPTGAYAFFAIATMLIAFIRTCALRKLDVIGAIVFHHGIFFVRFDFCGFTPRNGSLRCEQKCNCSQTKIMAFHRALYPRDYVLSISIASILAILIKVVATFEFVQKKAFDLSKAVLAAVIFNSDMNLA